MLRTFRCLPSLRIAPAAVLFLSLLVGRSTTVDRTLQAAEPPAGASFSGILDHQNKERLRAVVAYTTSNPDAPDVDRALQWIFETARTDGLEAEALPAAEAFLKRPDPDPAVMQTARQVLCLGLARTGRLGDALDQFDQSLRGVRFQAANRTFDFAQSLAAQARLAGEFNASREVYERVAAAFPLSPQIGEIAAAKIAKLDLIGQPAPRIGASDLKGKRVDWDDYAGKVVLVDFWATNCPPCLAEFPNMLQVYQDLHPKGFEILGISLDESPDIVEAFRQQVKLPWRMVMNESPEGAIGKRFKLTTIPALYFIDQKGNVAQLDMRGPDLRTTVERLLEGKPIKSP